jgi:hypothetical protein
MQWKCLRNRKSIKVVQAKVDQQFKSFFRLGLRNFSLAPASATNFFSFFSLSPFRSSRGGRLFALAREGGRGRVRNFPNLRRFSLLFLVLKDNEVAFALKAIKMIYECFKIMKVSNALMHATLLTTLEISFSLLLHRGFNDKEVEVRIVHGTVAMRASSICVVGPPEQHQLRIKIIPVVAAGRK